ncbi:hypothetical protein V6N13_002377 [Hibiscus sabdariffa]
MLDNRSTPEEFDALPPTSELKSESKASLVRASMQCCLAGFERLMGSLRRRTVLFRSRFGQPQAQIRGPGAPVFRWPEAHRFLISGFSSSSVIQ